MIYAGKYKDMYPEICAAGKPVVQNVTVADTLKEFPLVDRIEALKHDAGITGKEPAGPYPLSKTINHRNVGIFSEVRKCLNPPALTRFQTLVNDIKEATYSSYWRYPLGTCRDPVPGLPEGMDYSNTRFGDLNISGDIGKDIINPQKSAAEVLADSKINHEQYKKIYNDYNPGERIDRLYTSPPYDSKLCHGLSFSIDPMGSKTRCSLDWHNNDSVLCGSRIRADLLKRNRMKFGKSWEPNENIKCVPKGHAFGDIIEKPLYGVEELLKSDVKPRLEKRDVFMWLSSLNRLKLNIKRKSESIFNFNVLLDRMMALDREETGFIPVDHCFDVLNDYELQFNRKHIESLMRYMKIVHCGKIDYEKFIDVLGPGIEFGKQIDAIPPEKLSFISTYQAKDCDQFMIDNSDHHPAGVITSAKIDLPRKNKSPYENNAAAKHLGDFMSADVLMKPSIFLSYGLTYRDFYRSRTKPWMRKLFGRIGLEFTNEQFDKLWKIGQELDERPGVCVETFYKLVKHVYPNPKINVDELECRR